MLLITSDTVKVLGANPFHFHRRAEARSFPSTSDLSKVGLPGPGRMPAARTCSGVACLSKGTIPRELNSDCQITVQKQSTNAPCPQRAYPNGEAALMSTDPTREGPQPIPEPACSMCLLVCLCTGSIPSSLTLYPSQQLIPWLLPWLVSPGPPSLLGEGSESFSHRTQRLLGAW